MGWRLLHWNQGYSTVSDQGFQVPVCSECAGLEQAARPTLRLRLRVSLFPLFFTSHTSAVLVP